MLLNREKVITLQNSLLMRGDLTVESAIYATNKNVIRENEASHWVLVFQYNKVSSMAWSKQPVAVLKPEPLLNFNSLISAQANIYFDFHSHEHSSYNYCWNTLERGSQFDMPSTKRLTSMQKLSRVIQLFWTLQAIIGLQKIKIIVGLSKYLP